MNRSNSITNKIIFGSIINLCFLVVILGYNYLLTKNIILTNINKELVFANDSTARMISASINTSVKTLIRSTNKNAHELIRDYYMKNRDKKSYIELKVELIKLLNNHYPVLDKDGVVKLFVLDSKGLVIYNYDKNIIGKSLATDKFIKEIIGKQNGFINSLDEDKKNSKISFISYFKEYDWIIVTSISSKYLTKMVNISDYKDEILNKRFGKTGYSYIIDVKGEVILHPSLTGGNMFNVKDSEGRAFIRDMINEKNGEIHYYWKNYYEKNPRKKIVIFKHIPKLNWIVASGSYTEEFMDPLSRLKQYGGLLLFVVVSFSIILIWYYKNNITKPLNQFCDEINSISESGNYMEIDMDGRGEIKRLTHSFNSLINKIKDYSENMENLVDEKTEELIFVNNRLTKLNAVLNKKNENLFIAATTDKLTQVYNRSHLMKIGEEMVEKSKVDGFDLSVIILDVDHFKRFNDNYGHQIGDLVLKETAKIIQKETRKDDIFGRYGGEEFILIVPFIDSEKAYLVAEKIRISVEKTIIVSNENKLNVRISLGIADNKRDEKLEKIIKKADVALYQSKNNGRNQSTIYNNL